MINYCTTLRFCCSFESDEVIDIFRYNHVHIQILLNFISDEIKIQLALEELSSREEEARKILTKDFEEKIMEFEKDIENLKKVKITIDIYF